MKEAVSFKGNKDGIVLLLDCNIEFETLCREVVQKLKKSQSFLGDHADMVINSGKESLTDGQRLAIKVLLQSLGHDVLYFIPEETKKEEQLPEAGAMTDVAVSEADPGNSANDTEEPQEETPAELNAVWSEMEHYLTKSALAIKKNIRSGQKIMYDGSLVVFGDVNAGAELVATGHILVLGTLRGVAHAGCQGDKEAIVYATQMKSVQLRIADRIGRAPDEKSQEPDVPAIARIIDDYVAIEEA